MCSDKRIALRTSRPVVYPLFLLLANYVLGKESLPSADKLYQLFCPRETIFGSHTSYLGGIYPLQRVVYLMDQIKITRTIRLSFSSLHWLLLITKTGRRRRSAGHGWICWACDFIRTFVDFWLRRRCPVSYVKFILLRANFFIKVYPLVLHPIEDYNRIGEGISTAD